MTSDPVAFGKTEWTIAQTFAWVCLRDPCQMDKAFGVQTVPMLETSDRALVPLPEAERQIREHLAQSRLHCTGVRNGNREPIPSSPWVPRRFLYQSNAVRDLVSSDRWDSVLFARTDVLALWPPDGDTIVTPVVLRADTSNIPILTPGPKKGSCLQKRIGMPTHMNGLHRGKSNRFEAPL